jgi:hypothetical protein
MASVVVLSLGVCADAAAAGTEAVGAVAAVRGAVFVDAGGALQPLAASAPVHEGDAIVTHDGKAKVALDDGTIISIAEHTRVRIERVERVERRPPGGRARLALVSGALRLLVAKVAPAGNFEVETETAIAAVRGTDWLMEAGPEQTSVALLAGAVAVSSRSPSARSTVVLRLPGHGTDVRRDAPPTPPIAWGARRLADLLARATFN